MRYPASIRRSNPPWDSDDVARLAHAIAWFADQHGAWARATIRKHRAEFRLAIEDLSSAAWPDKSRIDDLYFTLDNSSPRPRDKAAPPQASAKKRKSLPHAEFLKLLGHLRSKRRGTARMLAGVVAFGALIGVRPIQWKDARLDGETLFVRCAKHTNGRGLDEVREIELIGWKEIERQTFQRFLSAYQEAGEAADSWQQFHERLAKHLTRACQELHLRNVSLYTLRHQALATAKRFLSATSVAALAGQACETTATRYYAKSRSGWGEDPRVRPTMRVVAFVRPGRIARPPEDDLNRSGFAGGPNS